MQILSSHRDIHLPRRLFHMAFGIILGGMGLVLEPKAVFVFFLACLTAFSLLIEILRLAFPQLNRFTQILGQPFLRDCEKYQMTGATYYLIGCLISAMVFPRAIAVLSIFYLGLGDPVASLAGLKWGKKILTQKWFKDPSPWAQKSLEGSLACFFICMILTFFVTLLLGKTEGLSFPDRVLFSFFGGIAAMLGEFLPLRTDDNLSLPLISGAALWLSATVFQLLPGLYF